MDKLVLNSYYLFKSRTLTKINTKKSSKSNVVLMCKQGEKNFGEKWVKGFVAPRMGRKFVN